MMKIWTYLACILIVIIIYNILLNFYRIHRCKKLLDKYTLWVSGEDNNFEQDKAEVLFLFKKANIKDSVLPVSQPIGFGNIASFTTSVQANILKKIVGVVPLIFDMFDESIGCYKFRLRQCINPLFWIEKIIFLPKSFFLFIGLNLENSALKLCNILFSLIWWIFLFFVFLFGDNLYIKIKEFISQI